MTDEELDSTIKAHRKDHLDYFKCHDCKGYPDEYMVKSHTWHEAWPSYTQEKRQLLRLHPPPHQYRAFLLLCFSCLEKRLKRPLMSSDFDLDLPCNAAVRLGFYMGRAEREK